MALTHGDWALDTSAVSVDPAQDGQHGTLRVVFAGFCDTPLERHVYAVTATGLGDWATASVTLPLRLTPAGGYRICWCSLFSPCLIVGAPPGFSHATVVVAQDHSAFVTCASALNVPPKCTLHVLAGCGALHAPFFGRSAANILVC